MSALNPRLAPRRAWCALALAGTVAATAAQAETPRSPDHRIELGHRLAVRDCSSCHAIGSEGTSPDRRAPPFRTLSGRYVELTLMQTLTDIAETGHYDMPPIPVHTPNVRAIVAYINSLPPEEPSRPQRP